MCVHGRALTKSNPSEFLNTGVLDYWKEKYDDDNIVWIYYATEEGVLFNYPASTHTDIRYDPRFRST